MITLTDLVNFRRFVFASNTTNLYSNSTGDEFWRVFTTDSFTRDRWRTDEMCTAGKRFFLLYLYVITINNRGHNDIEAIIL